MSSRPAARGSEAARSIRLALRTSSMVAVSSASPSRCFLFWPGRRARIASLIVLATVAIPPTTQPHPLPIRPHAPRRRLGCAAQETLGGEVGDGADLEGDESVVLANRVLGEARPGLGAGETRGEIVVGEGGNRRLRAAVRLVHLLDEAAVEIPVLEEDGEAVLLQHP